MTELLRNETPDCPSCKSRSTIRFGKRVTRKQPHQVYRCKDCGHKFTLERLKNTTYPSTTIIRAMTIYNQGHSQARTVAMMRKRYKTDIPQSTISHWSRRYSSTFTFLPLRKKYKVDPDDTFFTRTLHHQQVFDMKYHRLKLNIGAKRFPSIAKYIIFITKNPLDEIFSASKTRCSTFKYDTKKIKTRFVKRNNATELTALAETLAKTNKERHEVIEDFFLTNDGTTFAVELPVYITPEEAKRFQIDIKEPLTGHIDLLQFRNDKIFIMDYKPDTNLKYATNQLLLYAYCLNRRTGIDLKNIRCAAFNKDGYLEIQPK